MQHCHVCRYGARKTITACWKMWGIPRCPMPATSRRLGGKIENVFFLYRILYQTSVGIFGQKRRLILEKEIEALKTKWVYFDVLSKIAAQTLENTITQSLMPFVPFKIFIQSEVYPWQSCKSSRAAFGLKFLKNFRADLGPAHTIFYNIQSNDFFFPDVHSLCSQPWILWAKWLWCFFS